MERDNNLLAINTMIAIRQITLFFLIPAYLTFGCNKFGQSEREQKARDKIYQHLGAGYNKVRIKLRIPLLPDHGWRGAGIINGHDLWTCIFEKTGALEDTSARHAVKEIFCYTSSGKPIREADLYYSGRKYIEEDPDSFGWERLELDYDYVSDSIPNITYQSEQSSFTHIFKKGRRQAFLVGPHRDSATSNAYEGTREFIHLVRDTITLSQADSVLKSWGIKQGKGLD